MLDLADLSGRMPFLMQVQRDLCLLSSSSRDLLLLAKCVNHYIVDISNELKKYISGLKYWDVISLPNRFYLAGVKVETWSWQHKSILQVSRLLHLDVLLSTANSLMVLRDGSSPAVVSRESVLKLQNLYKVHVCVWLCVCVDCTCVIIILGNAPLVLYWLECCYSCECTCSQCEGEKNLSSPR